MSDANPGANADLLAGARAMIAGVTFWGRDDGTILSQREAMIARLADALEAADLRARVLPTREEIATYLRQGACKCRTCEGISDEEWLDEADALLTFLTGGKTDAE